MNPIFYGVGVGPGDPELLTLKALRMMREADILAVPGRDRDSSLAYRIALGADRSLADKECLCIPMPMTKDANKLDESHAAGAKRICEQLAAGHRSSVGSHRFWRQQRRLTSDWWNSVTSYISYRPPTAWSRHWSCPAQRCS